MSSRALELEARRRGMVLTGTVGESWRMESWRVEDRVEEEEEDLKEEDLGKERLSPEARRVKAIGSTVSLLIVDQL